MQFITTDQRIAVENFEIGLIYTVTFTGGRYFSGACIGKGADFVMFQRTEPELIYCLNMVTAADVASIDPLPENIGQILEYTGSVPTTIKTDGSPLLDYLITGNTIQNGTPTPDSPIIPEGCGERTENLFNVNRQASNTWTIDDKYYIDGAVGDSKSSIRPDTVDVSISNIRDLTVTARSYYGAGFVVAVTPNTTYTISFTTDTAVPSSKSIATITYVNADEDFLNYITIYGGTTSVTFTTPNTAYYILITFRYTSNTITYSDIMLNTGSTALPYEPYGMKIQISSTGQTTPVYLGVVQSTRRIKKLVLTGEESWSQDSNVGQSARYYTSVSDMKSDTQNLLSSHFTQSSGYEIGTMRGYRKTIYFSVDKTIYATVADFKAWLAAQYAAGTPVCVWYVLATEKTAVVNEPLMRISTYADTLSYRQSGVNIPTADGLNVFDISTTLKPSEVYLKYFSPIF